MKNITEYLETNTDYLKDFIDEEFKILYDKYEDKIYLPDITASMLRDLKITCNDKQKRNFQSWVYNMGSTLRKIEKQKQVNKMLADGWHFVEDKIVKKAFVEKKKLLVKGSQTNAWLTVDIDKTYKPFVSQQGTCFLMKPRARSRGYSLGLFRECFCKII